MQPGLSSLSATEVPLKRLQVTYTADESGFLDFLDFCNNSETMSTEDLKILNCDSVFNPPVEARKLNLSLAEIKTLTYSETSKSEGHA